MQQIATTYPEHARAIWKLGIPLILSNMAQFAIHMTDTLMLGWYDVTALAAATIATSLFFVVFIVGAGFAQAITPLWRRLTNRMTRCRSGASRAWGYGCRSSMV